MFSYFVLNIEKESVEHFLGTQEALDYYHAYNSLHDKITKDFPESEGWELKSFLLNDEPIMYIGELDNE